MSSSLLKVIGTDGRTYLLNEVRQAAVQQRLVYVRTGGGATVGIPRAYAKEQAVVDLYGGIPAIGTNWITDYAEVQEKARKDALAKQNLQNQARVRALNPKTSGSAKGTNSSGGPAGSFKAAFSLEKKNADWNLPPHLWSLPMRSDQDGKYVRATQGDRRGQIFFYAYGSDQKILKLKPNPRPGGPPEWKNVDVTRDNSRAYGFQFMWNPESYNVQNALLTTATPSSGDIWVSNQGMFPGASSISFTIRLDRTNDFAAILNSNESAEILYKNYYSPGDLSYSITAKHLDKANKGTSKIAWLRKYGTMADIEYLYRVCNDINLINRTLADGFVSADVGYIGYALVGIELGPVSYTGYITGISINHITFNENYVPIRTDVTIGANVMAVGTGTTLATRVGGP